MAAKQRQGGGWRRGCPAVAAALVAALLGVGGPADAAGGLSCEGEPAVEAGHGFEGGPGRDVIVITDSGPPGPIGTVEVDLNGGDDLVCLAVFDGLDIHLGSGDDRVLALPSRSSIMTNVTIRGGGGDDRFDVIPGIRVPNPVPLLPDVGDIPLFHGGPGVDWVRFDTYRCGLNLDLDPETGGASPRAPLTCPEGTGLLTGANLRDFERATGTAEDDELVGNGRANWLIGGGGGDRLKGLGGDDYLDGRGDDDQLWGGGGADILAGGPADDQIFTGGGDDSVLGEGGDDVVHVGPGRNTLSGGTGRDVMIFPASSSVGVTVDLEAGTYRHGTIGSGEISAEEVWGTAKRDTLLGSASADVLRGRGGADVIRGRAGADELHGEAGGDTIHGGAGADELRGGTGDDTLFGRSGDDVLHGNEGFDVLDGGLGDDFCSSFEEATGCDDGSKFPPELQIDTGGGQIRGCRHSLNATVTDLDLEYWPHLEFHRYRWSAVTVPPGASVGFDDATAQDTIAEFSQSGTYTLMLRVDDNFDFFDTDTVTFDVIGCGGQVPV